MNRDDRQTHDDVDDAVTANPGYAIGQLARAFATRDEHPDEATRARAGRKIDTWTRIFEGMLSGALNVGSRTPVGNTPAWATLEVAKGGFATGQLLAGNELQAHEVDLLQRIPTELAAAERGALNSHYLTDEGLEELRQMLNSGCYRITVPEEGALLVVAWLLDRGYVAEARSILDEIGPFLSQLRFYPVSDPRPLTASSTVHLQTVGETVQALRALRPRPEREKQKEAILVWAPLYDRAVQLFVETVEEGWPCQYYSADWARRAHSLLDDYRRAREKHKLCRKPDNSGHNFAILRTIMAKAIRNPMTLSGREVGMVRHILAGIEAKRGLPKSQRCRQIRAEQIEIAGRPTAVEFARVLVARLLTLPQNGGLEVFEAVTAPITASEATEHAVPEGALLPETLRQKLLRCTEAPVEVLVEQGVIPSAEVLAQVVPQISSQIGAAGISDPELRRLYAAIYQAFRKRRSLLLLNLESQVRLQELPWVKAIAAHSDRHNTQGQARQALEEVVLLAFTAFPEQIVPNKLLQELRALADSAGMQLPLVDELATDIFMGEFSGKFVRAAKTAAAVVGGTLYERYYGVPTQRVLAIDDVQSTRFRTATSGAFAALCRELAGVSEGTGRYSWRSPAENGKIIEQEQILTTHNLAVLVADLGLRGKLDDHLNDLADQCFKWVCRRLQQTSPDHHGQLVMIKNSAYAWRQMVFFLSFLPEEAAWQFVARSREHLSGQDAAFQARFGVALDGLVVALSGGTSGRTFLGWTTEKHWLLS